MAVLDGRVVFAAANECYLVAIDFRLPLTRRPLLGVDGDTRGLGVQLPVLDAPGHVADVVVVSVGRGLARERVLATERFMIWIGEPPEHGAALGELVALADEPKAVTVSDSFADFVRDGFVERGGAGHDSVGLSGGVHSRGMTVPDDDQKQVLQNVDVRCSLRRQRFVLRQHRADE